MNKKELQERKQFHNWRLQRGITECQDCGKKFTSKSPPHHYLCHGCWLVKRKTGEYLKAKVLSDVKRGW